MQMNLVSYWLFTILNLDKCGHRPLPFGWLTENKNIHGNEDLGVSFVDRRGANLSIRE